MSDERAKPDPNAKAGGVIGGYAHTDAVGATSPTIVIARINSTTGRLLVDQSSLDHSTDNIQLVPSYTELSGVAEYKRKYYTNAGAVTDGIIWSPAAGKRWYMTDIFIGVSANATVTLEDDLAGGDDVVWKHEVYANSGWTHSFVTPLFSGEDAADLLITTSAGNVYVMVTGYEV